MQQTRPVKPYSNNQNHGHTTDQIMEETDERSNHGQHAHHGTHAHVAEKAQAHIPIKTKMRMNP